MIINKKAHQSTKKYLNERAMPNFVENIQPTSNA
jgi:hypothetical protein